MEHGEKTQFKLWILKSAIRNSKSAIRNCLPLLSAFCPQTSNIFSVFRQLLIGILATYNLSSNGIVFALHRVTNEQMLHASF
jgi:hypothetical protein